MLRHRQVIYFPIATVMGVVLAFGIFKFLTLENTAPIKTVPPAVNVAVLVTATPQGVVQFWDTESYQIRKTLSARAPVWPMAVSSDGKWLAAAAAI